jgi:mannose-6-phosphate isomerase-like protein (cupin superfamily)
MYVNNIEKDTLENENFRKVLNTAEHSQLVVMSLLPGEEIGNEVHPNVDQFIRLEQGTGKAVLNNSDEFELGENYAIVIPAGSWHNIINTGSEKLKLYTIYTPPNHPEGTIHKTKEEAEEAEEKE